MASDRSYRKRPRPSSKDSDEDAKKQRGRPRVEGQDETAADRRRTQIRLAQRAYRQRKENTITDLKGQVSNLQSTIEAMSKAFLAFNDTVVGSNVLPTNPDLARELRNTTEHFLFLSKSSANQETNGSIDSDMEHSPPLTNGHETNGHSSINGHAITNGRSKSSHSNSISPEESPPRRVVDIGLGYVQVTGETGDNNDSISSDSPDRKISHDMSLMDTTPTSQSMQGMTSPDFTLFPITAPEQVVNQTYFTSPPTPQLPLAESKNPSPYDSLPLLKGASSRAPYTFSVEESTFARRLHRATLERGYHLLSNAQQRPSAYMRVFRLSLQYYPRETLIFAMRRLLTRSSVEPLECFNTPFIHLGGAGEHYGSKRPRNSYIIKSGPLRRARLQHVETGFDPGVELDYDPKDYEGEWFDTHDVEGYLLELGLTIDPRSTFAETKVVEDSPMIKLLRRNGVYLDDMPMASIPVPWAGAHNGGSSTDTSGTSPSVPQMTQEALRAGTERLFPELGIGDVDGAASNPDTADWLVAGGERVTDFLTGNWNAVQHPTEMWEGNDIARAREGSKGDGMVRVVRTITVDVGNLIDYLIGRAICLGRAPGFRRRDVEQALMTSIVEVT